MEKTTERRYTTLFGSEEIEDDYAKLCQEFGVKYKDDPNRPRVFLNSNPEDDEDFKFLDFDDDEEGDEQKQCSSAFLDNIRIGAAIDQTTARGLVIIGLLVVGYILVKCIRKIVE